jgi:glycosyltransferase involved in cell wall biosynthesis
MHVIPPGIDEREFPRPNSTKDIDIVAAGSLIPLKQYHIFIEVVAELKKPCPQ